MAAYPESLLQADLRPVATLVGDPNVLDELRGHLQTAAHERRMEFNIVGFTHIFDSRKEGKSFEKYTPEGILKLAWTTKCKDMSPATLALFFNWAIGPVFTPPLDSFDWKTKEAVIVREIRRFREQTQGRTLKLCAVVVLPQSELTDPGLEEKGNLLKKACELDSKSLFFISDDLASMVFHFQRIEKALFENAVNHYKEEIERLKKLKTRAQKEAPGYIELQVRYNFKLGYYSELRLEKDAALAYYKRAYQNLQEMTWKSFAEFEEIRTVSDWTILRLYQVFLSVPYTEDRMLEAITYFQKHFQKYRHIKEVREPLLDFVKWKWAAEQMGYFGKLLEQVPSELYRISNLWTLPGFYYYNAAMFEGQRKTATDTEDYRSSLANWLSFMSTNQLRMKDSLFVGQPRSIASHPLQMNITEGLSPSVQLLMTKCMEEAGNSYADNIDKYLNAAWKFYKSQKSLQRTQCAVSVQLSNSYQTQGNIEACIKLKENALRMFKSDGWSHISRDLCIDLIQCHESLGQHEHSIMYMLEVIKYDKGNSLARFNDLMAALESTHVDNDFPCSLISAKVKFKPKTLFKFEEATVLVTLTSHFPTAVDFQSIAMYFNDVNLNQNLAESISLPPETPVVLQKSVILKSNLINTLELLRLVFDWRPVAPSKLALTLLRQLPLAKASIHPPEPQVELDIQRAPSALIGEYLDLTLTLKPKNHLLKVTLFIEEDPKQGLDKPTRKASIDRETPLKYRLFVDENEYESTGVQFSDLESQQTVRMKLLFYEEGVCALKARVRYHVRKRLSEEFEYKNELIYPLDIPVSAPFQTKVLWHYPELYFQHSELSDLQCLPKGKVCDLSCCLTYTLPESSLTVYRIVFESKSPYGQAAGPAEVVSDDNEGVTLGREESFSSVFQVVPTTEAENVSLGDLLVQWSRAGGSLASCRVPLPPVCVAGQPYEVSISYPSEVSVEQTFPYRVRIQNLSQSSLTFTLRMVGSSPSTFLWGGYELMKLKVEKDSDEEVEYLLLPVETGLQQLPKLEITMVREDKKEFTEHDAGRAIIVLPA